MIQQAIDKYVVIEELGRGGFATVYLAKDSHMDQLVALKVLSPHTALEGKIVKRFEREAQALAKLAEHPHIITVYDFGEADGAFYLAMEYWPGGSLQAYLRAQPEGYLPTTQVFAILEQLASALDYAHSKGMIHRDIKPDNVLLDHPDQPRQVVLTDFGLVKYPIEDETLTFTSMVLGTRGYIAPEQLVGSAKEVTLASDIYALSVLAYRLFTGEIPSLLSEPADPLKLNPILSDTIANGLSQGLAKRPEDRPTSAKEFIGLLKARRKPIILVVDDDKNMRRTIEHILKPDYTVKLAGGPDEAVARLKEQAVDLIIVDLDMANDERAGFRLLETVSQAYPRLRKVILTAKYDLASVTEGYDYGVEAYVPKDQHMAANLRQKLARSLG